MLDEVESSISYCCFRINFELIVLFSLAPRFCSGELLYSPLYCSRRISLGSDVLSKISILLEGSILIGWNNIHIHMSQQSFGIVLDYQFACQILLKLVDLHPGSSLKAHIHILRIDEIALPYTNTNHEDS